MHLSPGAVHNVPKVVGGSLPPMYNQIPDSYFKREMGLPGNSGLSYQH